MNGLVHFGDKDAIVEGGGFAGSETARLAQLAHFLDPLEEIEQAENTGVGHRLDKVGVFDGVARIL